MKIVPCIRLGDNVSNCLPACLSHCANHLPDYSKHHCNYTTKIQCPTANRSFTTTTGHQLCWQEILKHSDRQMETCPLYGWRLWTMGASSPGTGSSLLLCLPLATSGVSQPYKMASTARPLQPEQAPSGTSPFPATRSCPHPSLTLRTYLLQDTILSVGKSESRYDHVQTS